VENQTAFKVAVDLFVGRLLCSKLWPRPGAGKLITIYPSDESRFIDLIDKVYYGEKEPVIVFQGENFSDKRTPYFKLPPWVTDPFEMAGVRAHGG